ncbi:hypothetical protein ACFFOM_04230 [Microlunatus capsulatus]|uniref:Capsular polysaccharide biosynthesis protein n=1 Tax=Microlunatus capsulatus TaxID=99117 RepID=A0ABS4Z4E2_9ACTN|nr:hypothetical protein [Microlunatus capsulatus]MBP2415921.1 hypothetical protein [Microlunatus capsulatus]
MSATARPGSALRPSVVAGAVLALLALVVGVLLALAQERVWTAESVVVVLPAASLDDATSAAYYETMSRGQIVATFAEVADNLRFEQQAEDRLQLSAAQREAVSTEVTVVPDTSVLLVRTTADDAGTAEQVADATTTLASEYLAGLSRPYRTAVVHTADGSAYASGTSPLVLVGAAVVVALVGGLAVQQALYHLLVAVRGPGAAVRRRGAAATAVGDGTDPDPGDAAARRQA